MIIRCGFFLIFATLLCLNSHSQDSIQAKKKPRRLLKDSSLITYNTKAVKNGNIILDGFYAVPNLYKFIIKIGLDSTFSLKNGNFKTSVSGIGPLGANVIFVQSTKFGIGAELNYLIVNYKATENFLGKDYAYNVRFSMLRAMVAAEYYFSTANRKLNFFVGLKAGVFKQDLSINQNHPSKVLELQALKNNGFGFAMRTNTGLRYFLNDNFALMGEVGFFGGGMMRLGVSAKL
jgi:hypothetical protein